MARPCFSFVFTSRSQSTQKKKRQATTHKIKGKFSLFFVYMMRSFIHSRTINEQLNYFSFSLSLDLDNTRAGETIQQKDIITNLFFIIKKAATTIEHVSLSSFVF
jgi:hypothetical protein